MERGDTLSDEVAGATETVETITTPMGQALRCAGVSKTTGKRCGKAARQGGRPALSTARRARATGRVTAIPKTRGCSPRPGGRTALTRARSSSASLRPRSARYASAARPRRSMPSRSTWYVALSRACVECVRQVRPAGTRAGSARRAVRVASQLATGHRQALRRGVCAAEGEGHRRRSGKREPPVFPRSQVYENYSSQ